MSFHNYRLNELYSNADGSVQFIELLVGNFNGESFWQGHSITATQGSSTHSFTFPGNLASTATANHSVLVATQGFADLGLVVPDFIVPAQFLFTNGATVNFGGVSTVTYASLPTDGTHSLSATNTQGINSPTNFAGSSGLVSAGGTVKSADLLAYSWKAHTLLEGVSVPNGAVVPVTNASGAIHLEAVADPTLTLAANRAVPSDEISATGSAVNLQDAIAILKMIVGLDVNGANKPLSPYQSLAADFDGNGTVNLTDAIGVLKHVVGLTSPDPTWHFLNEADLSIPAKANLIPGTPASTISADLSGSSPVHVGLVGYLSGDVDGSYAGGGLSHVESKQADYFTALVGSHSGLSLGQFGVYSA